MDPKRIAIGAVVGTITLNVVGFLIWGMLLADFFLAHTGGAANLERDPMVWWAIGVGGLLHGAFLTMILDWTGSASLGDAFKTGALVGLLLVGGTNFLFFGLFNIWDMVGMLSDLGLSVLQFGVTGLAIAAVVKGGAADAA